MYDRQSTEQMLNNNGNYMLTSKVARRLLILVFVQLIHERIEHIERLTKLFPLIFRCHDYQVGSHAEHR
jgi:hypothetical protein